MTRKELSSWVPAAAKPNLFNQIPHTPNFGGSASKPIFLTSHLGQGDFEQLVPETG